MPRFLYSTLFITLGALTAFVYLIFTKTPDSNVNIFLFFLTLFIFANGFLSILRFTQLRKKAPYAAEQKKMYRKAVKEVFVITVYFCVLLFLRSQQLLSPVTGGLFTAVYVSAVYLVKKSSK